MYGMPSKLNYLAIKCKMANIADVTNQLVAVDGRTDKVYWGGSPSHCYRNSFEVFEIVKDYGWDVSWPDEFDVDLQFAADFPLEPFDITKGEIPSGGLLSPDGKFYEADYGDHSSLCRRLLRQLGIDPEYIKSYEDVLLEMGWITLRWHYVVGDFRANEAQDAWFKTAILSHKDNTEFATAVQGFYDLHEDLPVFGAVTV